MNYYSIALQEKEIQISRPMRVLSLLLFLAALGIVLAGSIEEWPFDAAGRSINIRDGELRGTIPLRLCCFDT